MIKEDYVSFEVAKLLKEKGFPQEYDIYHSMVYNEEDYEDEYEVQRMVLQTRPVKAGTLSSYPVSVPEPKCYCPTHQMAMKWLREVYHIEINITFGFPFIDGKQQYKYFWSVVRVCDSHLEYPMDDPNSAFYTEEMADSYEEAIKAALKYCLENLI